MTKYPEADQINKLIEQSTNIVIVQADNPDGDSLASTLALEQILGDLGKNITLYCGVDIPKHLTHIAGWDRVQTDLPQKFDLSIIVDTSSLILLEQLEKTNQLMWLKSRPCIVLDHHSSSSTLEFATVVCNHPVVATGEIIYELGQQLSWNLNSCANELIAISIMTDSLGLVSEGTSARSIHIIAELVEKGVSLAALDNARRDMMRRPPEYIHYKGRLLQRVEFYGNNRIATITIPWEEIEEFSHAYNPSMLVLDDMRLAEGTDVAIAFKTYQGGRITAKVRCNYGKTIADKLAEHFGGGGHAYASGFKIQDGRSYETIKDETVRIATEMLDKLNR